jgi:HK97 family phage major capsid protein
MTDDKDVVKEFKESLGQLKGAVGDIPAFKKRLDELETKLNRPMTVGGATGDPSPEIKAFREWLRKGARTPEEVKAQLTQSGDPGGVLAPAEWVEEMIKTITQINPIRSVAKAQRTSQSSLKIPKRTAQFAAQWITETGTRAETTGLTVGLEDIPVHEFYAIVDVPKVTLEDAVFDVEAFLKEEFAEQFAVAEGTAFVTGNAVGRPEGIMTNADVAYVANGHATVLQTDAIQDLMYALKEVYNRNAVFLMRRATLGTVRKLKDGLGQYIYRPGTVKGEPGTIEAHTVIECPDMPAIAADAFPIAFGDISRAYRIADRLAMEVQMDPYTQYTSGCARYTARGRVGGQVVLPEAVKKLKISVS